MLQSKSSKAVLLLAAILALTWLCRLILIAGFNIELEQKYWARDFFANLGLAVIIATLVRTFHKALILSCLSILMLQMGNAAKLSILGTPASPDDFFNIQNLFFLTDGWRRWILIGIATLPFLLALLFFAYRKPRFWISTGVLLLSALSINAYSDNLRVYLDGHFGNSVWNQPANYRTRGLGLHLMQETIRTLSKVDAPPDKALVQSSLQDLADSTSPISHRNEQLVASQLTSVPPNSPQRNVHVFVLESFFDPLSLGDEWVPEDPLPDSFRQLWKETGNTLALSPVFGGYTANAEFEALCGFPVTRNAVFFEGWLRRKAPCLPHALGNLGYETISSHPNVPGFWNRTHAYDLIGFDNYLSLADFDVSDSVGTLLMDHSFYDQVFDKLQAVPAQSGVLNYMLTYYGHLPYPSSDRYPDKVKAGKDSNLLHGYLNQLWYKSRALMDRLEILRKQDPDALIVIFGDHLPFLGQNYGVYTDAWNLPAKREQFKGRQLERLVSTPLIVIDGQNGALELGKLPLYRLPSLITTLLGYDDQQFIFDLTRNPENSLIRPVYGMHVNITEDTSTPCTGDSYKGDACAHSQPWFENIETLIADVFTGKQYTLENR